MASKSRSIRQALRRTFVIDETVKYPVGFFVKSNPYPMWGGLFTLETKLFGPLQKTDPVYLLGADRLGRDMLSRIVYGTRISMSIGLIGVTLSLALGIVLGGISGYKGGTIDNIIQRVIEFILSLPTTPLWLGLAAAMPTNWPPLRVYLAITIILSLIGWTSLAQGDTWPLSFAPHRGFRHCRPARRGQRAAHHLPAHGAVVHQPYHRRGQPCHSDNDLGRDRAEFSRLGIAAAYRELGRIASGSAEHPRDLNRSLALCARDRRGYYRARLEFRRRWIARRSRPLQPMMMMMTNKAAGGDVVVEVKNLSTWFSNGPHILKAVDGIDLTLRRGRTLCVVGESGSGKSVTARSILNIVPKPGRIVSGEILLHGAGAKGQPLDLASLDPKGRQIRAVRGRDISMIFQEPMASLSPVHTIGQQIIETIRLHRPMSKADARARAIEALAQVKIPRPERAVDSYPFEFSGGMRQRAMTAMALVCEPRLVIADEPTTALDVTTQAEILDLMKGLQAQHGMALMFITHDMGVVAEIADDVAVMYQGRVVECGSVESIFASPQNPYTQRLLEFSPRAGKPFTPRCAHSQTRQDRRDPGSVGAEYDFRTTAAPVQPQIHGRAGQGR